ncbi:4-hydroxy-3-methylbut-2-enyl diphosphate reductase [Desulfovibrio inopinatus]|uniref:4-hydroxy-3-methylbut-2-enyl diphosphate reductase n=1 Tax=Desulfovibrio inopinatus TaxID=102109 RepID=UPI0004204904|nr:4-hydroxy-3-methylbut-2-enyl diphosphate reductase [Desulfovibrio inopinatus]
MEVIRAKYAGFCMGVDLALNKLDSLVENNQSQNSIYTLGPIIHNPLVLEDYAKRGVFVADSHETIPEGASTVIRAHGIPKQVEARLRAQNLNVVDATCPKVKKAQLLIGRQADDGRILLLFGEETHPEVKGLLSYAHAGAFVFGSEEELDSFAFSRDDRYCLAAQTTQDRERFETMAQKLNQREDIDVIVLHTICDATKRRQEEAVALAHEVDFMVVVGGFNSGNTRRLAKVVQAQGTPCVHVETRKDLPLDKLAKVTKIGMTSGASTPKSVFEDIYQCLIGL